MPPAHLMGDLRVCGATTVVVNQDFVFVDDRLWAVLGDPDSHVDGELINTFTGITINDLPVIVHTPDQADPDGLCIPVGPPHCDPFTAQGSDFVSAYDDG